MADTSQAGQLPPAEPQTNGIEFDEEDKNKLRPADIDAVSLISFCVLYNGVQSSQPCS
jgi:hypothetical protein